MGSGKTDNTPHYFNVNGMPIEVWFSPSDGTDGKIAGYISGTADYGVAYSILAFTSDPIADAMRAKYSRSRASTCAASTSRATRARPAASTPR